MSIIHGTPSKLGEALSAIRPWLSSLGYALTLDDDLSGFNEGQLGEYEAGSVFEKDIIIRVSLKNIRKTCREDSFLFPDFEEEVRLTVFHEVGHALVEQLLDYADNINEFLPELKAEYGDKFDEIFDEENDNEETLVEDFARGFNGKTKSLLQECVEACLV